jgi:threonine synthase
VLVLGKGYNTEAAAFRMSKNVFHASHNWRPIFLQGTKNLRYKIWKDLGFTLPDNVVIPALDGSNLLSCYLAFKELMFSGETDRMPCIFVSQPQNCSPLYYACHGATQEQFLPAIAEGAAITMPIRLQAIVNTIKETKGSVFTTAEMKLFTRQSI